MKATSNAIDHILEDHVHKASQVYPTLAGGVPVAGGAGAWALSAAFVPIVAAGVITERFDVHYLCIEVLNANDVFEIVLYYGVGNTEAGRVRVVKNAVMDGTMNIPIQTPIMPAGSQIDAKVASASGADTATISIFYHTY